MGVAADARRGASVDSPIDHVAALRPMLVVLAGPASSRPATAAALVTAGVPVLLEKPVAVSVEAAAPLAAAAEASPTTTLAIGYNLRHTRTLLQVERMLASGTIGNVLHGTFSVGQRLSRWRAGPPAESVSSRQDLGGGALLELSHEIDLALWFGGPVKHTTAVAARLGAEVVDVEDTVDLLLRHAGGNLSSVHLDMVRLPARRRLEVIGSDGRGRGGPPDRRSGPARFRRRAGPAGAVPRRRREFLRQAAGGRHQGGTYGV